MILKKLISAALILFFVTGNLVAQMKKADSLVVSKAAEKCLTYYEQGLLDSAKRDLLLFIPLTKKLLKSYPKNEYLNTQHVDAMDYLSYILFEQGNLMEAVSYSDSVLKYFESRQDSFNIALSLNNSAFMYQSQGMYEKAMNNYEDALKILNTHKSEDSKIYIGVIYNNIGLIHENRRMLDSTLIYHQKALAIRKQISDKRGISESLNNIGNALQKGKRIDEALPYLLEALALKREIKDANGITYTLNNVAIIYHMKGEYKKSVELAKESLVWAEKTKNVEAIGQVNKTLAKVNYKMSNYKEAYDHLQQFIIFNDSLNNVNNKKALYKHQVRSEFEKKEALLKAEQEKKDAISAEQIRRQKTIIYSGIGGSILLLITIIFIYRSYAQKRKSNIELTNKNTEISHQKHLIEEKSKEIMDSINYAKRIQTAILPPARIVKQYLPNSFVLYKPKDVVAGDFYWLETREDKVLFAAADCTGHGVPGAMVSVICNNGLNRSVREYGIKEPGKILDKTRELVIQEFEKSDEEVKDGMDISLCSLDYSKSTIELQWAGANNPLWIIKKGSSAIEEIKADKQPIGKYAEPKPFTTHLIELQSGDTIYIFTDGYQDQFGGEKGKKFKAAKLKELLLSIQTEEMGTQMKIVNTAFEEWKKEVEQVDDVCIIGVRL